MHIYFVISIGAFMGLFILFLVISKTLNGTVNHLTKLEYILGKELDYRREALEIRRIFAEKEKQSSESEEKKEFY